MIYLHKLQELAQREHPHLRATILVLAAWDESLFAHSDQVATELWRLAPTASATEWYWAGLLHDLGKIAVAPEILRKRGALTARERKAMQHHPSQGAYLLALIQAPQCVIQGAQFHHERWDGAGYPSRISGTEIPLVARVLAVADVYTALTSDRPYRRAYTSEQARLEIERNVGTQFDPEIVERFFRGSHATG
ncbi:Cyclic di-GMP phosphodiesterase [Anaerolineae bacterium]|nr:Cyclic di-GMP phosphodiesterase [Anaerolineae bacterium]